MKDDPMLPSWVESVLKIDGVEMTEMGSVPGVDEPCQTVAAWSNHAPTQRSRGNCRTGRFATTVGHSSMAD